MGDAGRMLRAGRRARYRRLMSRGSAAGRPDSSDSDRQAEMVAEALQTPGVADAVRIFEAARGRVPQASAARPVVRFATGANR
jgi:hypothetical protein